MITQEDFLAAKRETLIRELRSSSTFWLVLALLSWVLSITPIFFGGETSVPLTVIYIGSLVLSVTQMTAAKIVSVLK